MDTVSAVLRQKPHAKVVTISPRESVLAGARQMNLHRIGSLVVVEQRPDQADTHPASAQRVVGMFTERDVLTRVVAAGRDPLATTIADVMSSPVIVATPATSVEELRSTMRHRRIRHVPVVDDGHLVGLVSIGDVNHAETTELIQTVQYLEEFITRG